MIDRPTLFVFEFEIEIALVGDLHRIFDGFRKLSEGLKHFFRRLQIIFGWNQAFRTVKIEIFAVLDALKDLMSLGVLRLQIMTINGRYTFNPVAFAPVSQGFVHLVLLGKTRDLKLKIEIFAETLLEPLERIQCDLLVAHQNLGREFAAKTTRQNDKPVAILV